METKQNYILFWSTYVKGESHEEFINKGLTLSKAHALTLYSHKRAKQNTFLYTYQNISKSTVPEGITLMDANEVFPSIEAHSALNNGHSIAHVSDVVRIKESMRLNGVVMDMDLTVLRNFKNEPSFYSSMPAKRSGTLAPQWKDAHPPITIHDNSWDGKALCNFPLKISNKTKGEFQLLVDKIILTLSKPPKKTSKAWNYVLWTVKDIIKTDFDGKVYQPIYNLPLPAWLGGGKCYSLESPTRLDGKTILYGHVMPTIDEMLEKSNTIAHFFESVFNDANVVDNTFWHDVKDGSLLSREAQFIVGDNWREILTNYIK